MSQLDAWLSHHPTRELIERAVLTVVLAGIAVSAVALPSPLLRQVLFCVFALPTAGGCLVMVILAPKPSSTMDHVRAVARYLILGGAVFGIDRALGGWVPSPDDVARVMGIGIIVTLYARDQHLRMLGVDRRSRIRPIVVGSSPPPP